jgi:hypothetical protein
LSLLPHPAAITATAVKTIVSRPLAFHGGLIGEVISGPFSWFFSRAGLVLRTSSPLALAKAGWPVGRYQAVEEWPWVVGHIRGLSALGHDPLGRARDVRPHDLPLSDWLLAHEIRVLMVVSLQPVPLRFGLFTSHGRSASPWCLFMSYSSASFGQSWSSLPRRALMQVELADTQRVERLYSLR